MEKPFRGPFLRVVLLSVSVFFVRLSFYGGVFLNVISLSKRPIRLGGFFLLSSFSDVPGFSKSNTHLTHQKDLGP